MPTLCVLFIQCKSIEKGLLGMASDMPFLDNKNTAVGGVNTIRFQMPMDAFLLVTIINAFLPIQIPLSSSSCALIFSPLHDIRPQSQVEFF